MFSMTIACTTGTSLCSSRCQRAASSLQHASALASWQWHFELESSQSQHTSAKAMLFARWQHHPRFCSGFFYAPLKAVVTKISKWSRIQDSFRITHKIESLVVCAIPDIPSKFQKDPSITFWFILLTHRQTDRQINKQTQSGKNITFLAEVKNKKLSFLWNTTYYTCSELLSA